MTTPDKETPTTPPSAGAMGGCRRQNARQQRQGRCIGGNRGQGRGRGTGIQGRFSQEDTSEVPSDTLRTQK